MLLSSESFVISGWNVVSPIGIGRNEFAENFTSQRMGLKKVDDEFCGMKLENACVADDFNASEFLGSRGTRTFDRTTRLAVSTAKLALEDRGISESERLKTGIVLGSMNGSIKSITEFTRDSLVQEKPYFVNPSLFPNTVMNCAAGQCAIWHKLRGPNATLSAGSMSGLNSLQYSIRLLRKGYAEIVLAGSVEAYCGQSAWAFQASLPAKIRENEYLGEGCVLFTLEKKESALAKNCQIHAELVAGETYLVPRAKNNCCKVSGNLAQSIRNVLMQAQVDPDEITAISKHCCGGRKLKAMEQDAIRMAFKGHNQPDQFAVSDFVGNTVSASVSFQLAGALSYAPAIGSKKQGYILITSLSIDGYIGCLLLKTDCN